MIAKLLIWTLKYFQNPTSYYTMVIFEPLQPLVRRVLVWTELWSSTVERKPCNMASSVIITVI